ncbi:trypsin domain-containing protein [Ditylenchus destructor]|nr:trypsin domain-containing protein [Ditylenchus destructor]
MSFRKLLLLIVISSLLNISNSSLVGPRSWLKKLSDQELKEIDDACRPNLAANRKRKSSSNSISNRIVDGELVYAGKYPFAAAFKFPQMSHAKCGGTFITPRHMLTARHCFVNENKTGAVLVAGGVCHSQDEDDECSSMDMIEIEYEFAIFDSWAEFSTFGDLAIVQLAESVTERYPGRISFACLPSKTDELLLAITVLGWGRRKNDRLSSHLREVSVLLEDVPEEYFILGQAPASSPYLGANSGDSGSGAVTGESFPVRHILWGVVRSILWAGTRQTKMLKTSYFLEDMCHYIGLCLNLLNPSEESENLFGMQPKLNFDGVFLPGRQRSTFSKSMAPFQQISTESALTISNECKYLRSVFDLFLNPCQLSTTGWAIAIVDEEMKVLCDGVAVTYQHIITMKEVDKMLDVTPACFLTSNEIITDMSAGFRGYGSISKLIDIETGHKK